MSSNTYSSKIINVPIVLTNDHFNNEVSWLGSIQRIPTIPGKVVAASSITTKPIIIIFPSGFAPTFAGATTPGFPGCSGGGLDFENKNPILIYFRLEKFGKQVDLPAYTKITRC